MAMQASRVFRYHERSWLLRRAGMEIDDSVQVSAAVSFASPKVRIHKGCFVNVGCIFEGDEHIILEENVHLAPGVKLLTHTHKHGPSAQRAGAVIGGPIKIGRGAWLGAGTIVLPGINIAEGSIVGAGSIVTRRTEADSLWMGQPARHVRTIVDEGNAAEAEWAQYQDNRATSLATLLERSPEAHQRLPLLKRAS